MTVPQTAEKWSSAVNSVTLGATAEQGGTRTSTVTLGGAAALPFLSYEGDLGHRPVIAAEVWDSGAQDWPDQLKQVYGDVISSPAEWAKKAVSFGAELICLRLMGAHPDGANRSPDECAQTVQQILQAVGVPLIIWGCGADEKDSQILPAVSAAAKGENCLIGSARETNYRTVVAVCLADNHKLLAESPLDINIAKQVNIFLASDDHRLDGIDHALLEPGAAAGINASRWPTSSGSTPASRVPPSQPRLTAASSATLQRRWRPSPVGIDRGRAVAPAAGQVPV